METCATCLHNSLTGCSKPQASYPANPACGEYVPAIPAPQSPPPPPIFDRNVERLRINVRAPRESVNPEELSRYLIQEGIPPPPPPLAPIIQIPLSEEPRAAPIFTSWWTVLEVWLVTWLFMIWLILRTGGQ